ncbi:hypothetical protein [Desmospora profundinema]|uniref:Uncharacterized protein n=1 Tax=Desmospora profundinema TaxID=1571184 RepID=A0ABU1INF9_9BACL|nr:hypothetical protein [Desmospora profundinema]MDR6226324.1 hypothetical protein [Desmospora profundinema]
MSPFWIMVGLSLGLMSVGLVGWGLLRFYSRIGSSKAGQPLRSSQSVVLPSLSPDEWEWFEKGELAQRTGLSPDKSVPLSIEREAVPDRPDWIRLHVSVSQSEPQTIRRAVGEGLKRLDDTLHGGEVRVYTDGQWVGTGGMIRKETAVPWIKGLTGPDRETPVRLLRRTGTAVYGVWKGSD